jgi:hypothetical protein
MVAVQPQQQLKLIDRRTALAGLALAALAPLGCLDKTFAKKEVAPPPLPAPHDTLVTIWSKKVVYAPDPWKGGAVTPGLVGRIFLIGPGDKPGAIGAPYLGDGSLIVDLWDNTERGVNTEPKMMVNVHFPPEVLINLAKKDVWGDGYSIWIPWEQYRPDIIQVYVNVGYTSAAGEKLFGQSGTFPVDHSETFERLRKGMSVGPPAPAPTDPVSAVSRDAEALRSGAR